MSFQVFFWTHTRTGIVSYNSNFLWIDDSESEPKWHRTILMRFHFCDILITISADPMFRWTKQCRLIKGTTTTVSNILVLIVTLFSFVWWDELVSFDCVCFISIPSVRWCISKKTRKKEHLIDINAFQIARVTDTSFICQPSEWIKKSIRSSCFFTLFPSDSTRHLQDTPIKQ